jgi:hypothetical protein
VNPFRRNLLEMYFHDFTPSLTFFPATPGDQQLAAWRRPPLTLALGVTACGRVRFLSQPGNVKAFGYG